MHDDKPKLTIVDAPGGAMGAFSSPIESDPAPSSHPFAFDDHPLANTVHVGDMQDLETFNLWTEEVLSERLEIPIKTLQRWRAYGGGPRFVKLGRRVRYDPESVREWVKSREVGISREAS